MATRKSTKAATRTPAKAATWDVSFTAPRVSGNATVKAKTAADAERVVREQRPDCYTVSARLA